MYNTCLHRNTQRVKQGHEKAGLGQRSREVQYSLFVQLENTGAGPFQIKEEFYGKLYIHC